MNIKIYQEKLKGEIKAPLSKSQAHRMLIGNALAKSPFPIEISHISEDIFATQNALLQLSSPYPKIDCNESGTTLRFLLPIFMALKEDGEFICRGNLVNRPMNPLVDTIGKHGCSVKKDGCRYIAHGKLTAGHYTISGNVSSQFISGLLFALPLLDKDSTLQVLRPIESSPYIDLTISTLHIFGVFVDATEDNTSVYYNIKGSQSYIPVCCHSNVIEGDWSNSAFWLVANAMGSRIAVTGLNPFSKQGDRVIADIIKLPQNMSHVTIDASEIPDLVPAISVLAASTKALWDITGCKRLKLKESDRLSTVCEMINLLGGHCTVTEDSLTIIGKGSLVGGRVKSYNDHRIVMAAAIAATICKEPVIVEGAEAVNKSYPNFFRDFAALGGGIIEI